MKRILKDILAVLLAAGIVFGLYRLYPGKVSEQPQTADTAETAESSRTAETAELKRILGFADAIYMAPEDCIQDSSTGVTAVCVGSELFSTYTEYEFKTGECLWGSAEDTIWVTVGYCITTLADDQGDPVDYMTGENDFTVGEKYFIIADKYSAVTLRHGALYTLCNNLIISLDQRKAWHIGRLLDIPEEEVTPEYFLKIYQQAEHGEAQTSVRPDYGDAFEEMWNESEYVIRVKVTGAPFEDDTLPENPSLLYTCELKEQYHGEYPINTRTGMLYISLLKGTVEIGEEYIIGCTGAERGDRLTLVYRQETADSVFPVTEEILNMINKKRRDQS